jgi:acyl carrier protein
MSMQSNIRKFILTNYLFTDDETKLENSASLIQAGTLDSTGVLELIAFVEEKFGIQVADEEMVPANLDSVNSIVAFLARKKPVEIL